MKTIWKWPLGTPAYPVQDRFCLVMPRNAMILCIQMQGELPCLWAIVDDEQPKEERTFRTYGTGHNITKSGLKYLGTYQIMEGSLVFHLFEE